MLILEIRHVFLRSNFFSALDLNKFPKNLKIEYNVVTIQQRFIKMAKSPFYPFPIFFGSFLAFCH